MSIPTVLRTALLTGACIATISCSIDTSGPDESSQGFVDGVVLYKKTGGPVPGADVYITEQGGILDEWASTIETTRTDDDGEFRMHFTTSAGFNYYVYVGSSIANTRVHLRHGENQDVVLEVPSGP